MENEKESSVGSSENTMRSKFYLSAQGSIDHYASKLATHVDLWDDSGVPKEFGTSEVTQCRNSKHKSVLKLASAWHTGVDLVA